MLRPIGLEQLKGPEASADSRPVESQTKRAEADDFRRNAWLRRSRRTFWFVVAALGMAVAFVAMSLSLAVGSGSIPGAAIFGLVFAGPCLLFARRIGRAGLWMGPAGLVVRGPLRTWEVPGNSAVLFSPGVRGISLPQAHRENLRRREDAGQVSC